MKDIVTLEQAETVLQRMIEAGGNSDVTDNEVLHDMEDRIKNRFILSLSCNAYPTKIEAIKIAAVLNQITELKYTRWYA